MGCICIFFLLYSCVYFIVHIQNFSMGKLDHFPQQQKKKEKKASYDRIMIKKKKFSCSSFAVGSRQLVVVILLCKNISASERFFCAT